MWVVILCHITVKEQFIEIKVKVWSASKHGPITKAHQVLSAGRRKRKERLDIYAN